MQPLGYIYRRAILTSLGLVAAMIAACSTLDRDVPPVTPPIAAAGQAMGHPVDTLVQGRLLYLTHCGNCHVVLPVRDYDADHWDKVMPEMSHEARLTPDETTSIKAYLHSVLATPTP